MFNEPGTLQLAEPDTNGTALQIGVCTPLTSRLNVTVPVGFNPSMAAVKIVGALYGAGFLEDDSVTVPGGITWTATVTLGAAEKLALPACEAVRLQTPTATGVNTFPATVQVAAVVDT